MFADSMFLFLFMVSLISHLWRSIVSRPFASRRPLAKKRMCIKRWENTVQQQQQQKKRRRRRRREDTRRTQAGMALSSIWPANGNNLQKQRVGSSAACAATKLRRRPCGTVTGSFCPSPTSSAGDASTFAKSVCPSYIWFLKQSRG